MAEINTAEIEAFIARVAQAQARVGGLEGAMTALRARVEGLNRAMAGAMTESQNAAIDAKIAENARKRYANEINQISSAAQQGRISQQRADMLRQAAEARMNDTLESVGDEVRASFSQITSSINAGSSQTYQLTESFKKFNPYVANAINIIGSLGNSFSAMARSYQAGTSDIQMASVPLGLFIRMVQGAVGGLQGMIAAGRAGTGGFNKTAAGLSLLQGGLNGAAAVMEILQKSLEDAYQSFNMIHSSGAAFSDGLTGMVKAATDANLTLPEFAEVVRNNADNLAKSGVGISEAARQMGDISKSMRATGLELQLRRLGYSAKEQADLMATALADFAAQGKQLGKGANAQQLAQYTADYAANLRTLSSLTGEDAKRAMEKNRRAAFQADVYTKLAAAGPEAMAKFRSQLELFNKIDPTGKAADAFSQVVAGVTDITDPAIRAMGPRYLEMLQAARDNTLDTTKDINTSTRDTATAIGRAREALLNDPATLARQRELAGAGRYLGGLPQEIANLMGGLAGSTQFSEDAINNMAKAQEDARNAQDQNTEEMLKAAEAGRAFRMAMQGLVMNPNLMGAYAEALQLSTNLLLRLTGNAPGSTGTPAPGTPPPNAAPPEQSGPNNSLVELLRGVGNGIINGINDVGRAVVDGISRLTGNNTPPALPAPPQLARGGIVSGPMTGFNAILHGNEAVIPLPDSLRGPDFAAAMERLVYDNTTDPAVRALENSRSTGAEMMSDMQQMMNPNAQQALLQDIKQLMSEMLQETKNISGHTEMTSFRVA
jgi:hypothetical protein